MKILVTNDDSIKAEGLKVLVELAKKYGDVKVIAPEVEQSAKGHGLMIHRGLRLREVDLGLGIEAYSLDSTPADCVRAAFYGLKWDFDVVFSGINNGINLGEDIFYSGTCAAAVEAGFMKKPALAFSTFAGNLKEVVRIFDQIMDIVQKNKLLEKGVFNINVPYDTKGFKATFQAQSQYHAFFVTRNGLLYQEGTHNFERERSNTNSDIWAIINNYVSITPLSLNRTNYDVLQKLDI